MEKETEKIITEKIQEVLERMTFQNAEIEIKQNSEGADIFNIKSEESSFLIGQYGVNLQALQHIVRIVCKNHVPEKTNFILDINSYRQEKNDSIEKMAREQGMITPFQSEQVRENGNGRIISYGVSSYGYDVRCSNEFKIFTNINSVIVDP